MRLHRLVASAAFLGGCSFQLVPAGATGGDDAPPIDAVDAAPVPACLGTLCRRITITIDHAHVTDGPHARFPVLIDVTEPDLATSAATNGFDVTFTAADGTTVIPYEREWFSAGRLVAWIAVPEVSSTVDTVFYLFYGDRNATADAEAVTAVWGSAYQGVWHAEEGTGGTRAILDSSPSAHHGTDESGLMLAAPGKIGRAIQLDGFDDRLRIASTAPLEQATATATISLWVNYVAVQTGTYQRILMSANSITGDGSGFEWGSQPPGLQDVNYYYPRGAGGLNYHAIALPFTADTWHHAAVTQDFATKTVKIYVDGQLRAPIADNTSTMWTSRANPADWYWGGSPPRTTLAGRMDEMRIATVVRSAGWIATEYANQNAVTAFTRIGPTVVGP